MSEAENKDGSANEENPPTNHLKKENSIKVGFKVELVDAWGWFTRMGRLTSCVSLCSTAVAQATPSRGHQSPPGPPPPWRPLHYLAIWCNLCLHHAHWIPKLAKDIESLPNTRSCKWLREAVITKSRFRIPPWPHWDKISNLRVIYLASLPDLVAVKAKYC